MSDKEQVAATPEQSVVDEIETKTAVDAAAAPSGASAEISGRPRRFRSWLGWNILAVFLCFPLAAPGVWFSVKSLAARRRGDLALSEYHSKSARAFFWFAIVLGTMAILFYLTTASFPTTPR